MKRNGLLVKQTDSEIGILVVSHGLKPIIFNAFNLVKLYHSVLKLLNYIGTHSFHIYVSDNAITLCLGVKLLKLAIAKLTKLMFGPCVIPRGLEGLFKFE